MARIIVILQCTKTLENLAQYTILQHRYVPYLLLYTHVKCENTDKRTVACFLTHGVFYHHHLFAQSITVTMSNTTKDSMAGQ